MANRVSYYPGGFVAAAPQQNRSELFDGTAGTYTAWDVNGVQTAQRPLTSDEIADLAAMDTAAAQGSNQSTIRQAAQNALAANTTYLGIASPSNTQVAAQVKALTQQNNRIIRLIIGQFDATT